jgi:hypothetical protein
MRAGPRTAQEPTPRIGRARAVHCPDDHRLHGGARRRPGVVYSRADGAGGAVHVTVDDWCLRHSLDADQAHRVFFYLAGPSELRARPAGDRRDSESVYRRAARMRRGCTQAGDSGRDCLGHWHMLVTGL